MGMRHGRAAYDIIKRKGSRTLFLVPLIRNVCLVRNPRFQTRIGRKVFVLPPVKIKTKRIILCQVPQQPSSIQILIN